MTRTFLRLATLSLAFVCGFTTLHAQSAKAVAASARVHTVVDVSQRQSLAPGTLPPWATAENDRGSLAAGQRMDNLHLILARAPQVEAAFQQLLLDQQNSASPRFHQWLTPQQNAEQYGIAPSDLAAVENWLTSQGLQVDNVAAGGVFITFSGTAAAVQNAFGTAIHTFTHGSTTAYAALSEPTVPAALAGVIRTVSGLSQEDAHIYSHVQKLDKPYQPVTAAAGFQPDENFGTSSHYLAPADFNTIYDVPSATTGTGVHAVVLISSRIAASDITGFNSYFGLSVAQPTQILLPGSTDPGIAVAGGEGEADLDVQRILGTAPGASVDVLVFSSLMDTLIQSALLYETTTLNDPVVNMSFGSCAANSSPSRATTYDTYYSALAAQGVSITISSGDSAAGACETAFANPVSGAVASTNVLCASSWVTCVGGTEFNDTASPSTYWAATNNATTKGSALSYIPEGAWDEPTTTGTTSGFQAAGSGGGVTAFPKPTWQIGTGVPADTFRDVPDVAFSSALHVAYIVCEADEGAAGNNCATSTIGYVTLGTSAAAPSMAGVATLLNQKTGARAGDLNPLLYQLATSTPAAFHDATPTSSGVTTCSTSTPSMCNNSDPGPTSLTGGVVGYPLTVGYDLATGLGSLDVNAFLTAAAAAGSKTSTTLAVTATTNPISAGASDTFTATLTRSSTTPGAATGTVQFYNNGTAFGSPITISNNVAVSAAQAFPTLGTYSITAVYSGDTNYSGSTSSAVSLVVNAAPSFSVTPVTTAYNLISGVTTGNTDVVTFASLNSFAGGVTSTCTVTNVGGTAAGTCAMSPGSVTLTSGGTGTSTLTITTTPGTSGVLNVTVTGTSGTTVVTSSAITVNLTASSFTMAALPLTLNLTSGATTGNTSVVTLTSVNGFAGTVTVSCVATKTSGTAAGSCTATPATLTANGTATSTVTLTSTAGTAGVLSLAVSGSGAPTGGTIAATASIAAPIVATLTTPGFTLTPATASISLISGQTTANTVPITVTSTNSLVGAVILTCVATNASGTAAGSCVATPVTLVANGTATSTVTVTSTPGTSGTLSLAIGGTSGTVTATTPTPVVTTTLTAASFTATGGAAISVAAGSTSGTSTVALSSPNLFAGTVSFTCTATNTSGTAAGTCTVTPATLTAGGTATANVSLTTTLGTSGGLTLNITGTGTTLGAAISTSAATTVAATVAAPSFSLSTPTPNPLTIATSGATTGNTASTTLTSTAFAGTVNFTCAAAATSGSPASPATCAASSVTLTSGGTATSTITVTSVTAHAKESQLAGLSGWGIKGGALLAVMLCLVPFRRRFVHPLAALALLAFGLAALSGCGGGGSAPATKSSSDGTYTVTVTGTGTSTGATTAYTANTTFTLTITN